MSKTRNMPGGFSLIEIIAVLIIVGVLGAVAVSRISSLDMGSHGRVELVKNQIRYAQLLAMRRSEIWGVHSSGSDYDLFQGDPTTIKSFPGEKSTTIPEAFTVAFNPGGQPINYSSKDLLGEVTVTMGGSSFTIAPETGSIP